MKVSINAVRRFNQQHNSADNPVPEGVDKLVERIGAQLGGIDEVVAVGKKYEGIVIAKVISCEQHPNADRLHVCTIDDGGKASDVKRDESGFVTVVCGAPNVRTGLTVAWLPPGSTVPNSYNSDPFVLEARELRGVVSNGMLASPKELALGDSHDGILEIDDDVAPGTSFAEHYNLQDDVVIDIENKMFTHRPDCFGMMGVTREIAGIQGQKFTSPEWYTSDTQIKVDELTSDMKLQVRNEIPELVPRFVAVLMQNIKVAPSPVWLQVELSRLGVRPINNIVDLTNYHMLVTGQPMHAYDYDKVVAQDAGSDQATLVVRKPHEGEKLTLLNGKEIELRPEAIVIATTSKAIGLGGVMGGGTTEVDNTTTRIILECASFDMYSIRRTAMAHGVFTDAVTRFTKGQSSLQNLAVAGHIVDDIRRICGGVVTGQTDDNHMSPDIQQRHSLYPDITVDADYVNARLGLKLSAGDMAQLLTNVEFKVQLDGDRFVVRAPFWRTDIEIPEDVVEEVGRLYGFDKLPLILPRSDLAPASRSAAFNAQAAIRETLRVAGANEVLTYSFVHGNLLAKAGQNKELAFQLSNALSPDLQYYRLCLTPSLLDKVHGNIKAGFDEFALFEIGKVHAKTETDEEGLPKEFGRVAFVFAANVKAAENYAGAPYYQARAHAMNLLSEFGLTEAAVFVPLSEYDFQGHELAKQLAAPFEPQRSAVVTVDGKLAGIVGEYKILVRSNLKLPAFTAGFELFVSTFKQTDTNTYVALPRFPKVEQDISLKIPASVSYQQLYNVVQAELTKAQPEKVLSSLSPLDIYQRPDDTEYKQITLRLSIASYEKTLTDGEVVALLDHIASAASDKLAAQRG